PSGRSTSESPTVEPWLLGFTTTGKPSFASTSSTLAGAISHSGVGTPAARKSRFAMSLFMPSVLPIRPEPVYAMPARSSTACTVPSSPVPPCIARKTRSTSRRSTRLTSAGTALFRSAGGGGTRSTRPVSSAASSAGGSTPRSASTASTSWPRARSARTTWAALATETSRSMLSPPNSTAIFTGVSRPRVSDIVIDALGQFFGETRSGPVHRLIGAACDRPRVLRCRSTSGEAFNVGRQGRKGGCDDRANIRLFGARRRGSDGAASCGERAAGTAARGDRRHRHLRPARVAVRFAVAARRRRPRRDRRDGRERDRRADRGSDDQYRLAKQPRRVHAEPDDRHDERQPSWPRRRVDARADQRAPTDGERDGHRPRRELRRYVVAAAADCDGSRRDS